MTTLEHYEYLFLGGGKGGKTLAMQLARTGARVAVVEQGMIGGSCINVACIPSKTLIHSADIEHLYRSLRQEALAPHLRDMKAVQKRVRSVVDQMVEINLNAFTSSGLELILGNGRFIAPRVIEVILHDGGVRQLHGAYVFVNTGTTAAIPAIPGLAESQPLTHVEALSMDSLPDQLIVIGGGYIGLELAQAFRRLGSEVTIIHDAVRLANREDQDVSTAIEEVFRDEGISMRLGAKAIRVEGKSGGSVKVHLDDQTTVTGTHILVAAGRQPVTKGLGLDAAGVGLDDRGFIRVNEQLATSAEKTWAIGDVAGTPMFTHASYDDYRVLKSVLGGGNLTTKDRVIPYAMFIDPELARVGLNETEALASNIPVRVAKLPMAAVPRARTVGEMKGFMKMLIDPSSGQILGFTMLGKDAGEVMTVVQMAMLGKLPYTTLRDSIIAHPLMSEGLNVMLANL